MANQYGFTSVNQQVTSGGNTQQELLSKINEVNEKLIYARVTDIILDETHPNFDEYGQWASIGSIFLNQQKEDHLIINVIPKLFLFFLTKKTTQLLMKLFYYFYYLIKE